MLNRLFVISAVYLLVVILYCCRYAYLWMTTDSSLRSYQSLSSSPTKRLAKRMLYARHSTFILTTIWFTIQLAFLYFDSNQRFCSAFRLIRSIVFILLRASVFRTFSCRVRLLHVTLGYKTNMKLYYILRFSFFMYFTAFILSGTSIVNTYNCFDKIPEYARISYWIHVVFDVICCVILLSLFDRPLKLIGIVKGKALQGALKCTRRVRMACYIASLSSILNDSFYGIGLTHAGRWITVGEIAYSTDMLINFLVILFLRSNWESIFLFRTQKIHKDYIRKKRGFAAHWRIEYIRK